MLIALATTALAGWPEDPGLTNMLDHEGVRVVDGELLQSDWEQFVAELGTIVGNRQMLPASTTGTYGFEWGLSGSFIFTSGIERDNPVSPWDRVEADETSFPVQWVPTMHARKGLPFSTEIGGSIGWIGMTRTGIASVYGRVAIVEGYKPLPDLTLQVGYSGYVGNDEIELSVQDLGVTLGTQLGVGGTDGMNTGQFEPFASFTLLRVSAAPTVSSDVVESIGATTFRRGDLSASKPLAIPQIALGFQVTNGNVHFRLAGSWAPSTLPSATTGMGVTF